MIFIGHIVVFILAGFCMFYYRSMGMNGTLLIMEIALISGAVYFLGWWALASFFAGMVLGPTLAKPQ